MFAGSFFYTTYIEREKRGFSLAYYIHKAKKYRDKGYNMQDDFLFEQCCNAFANSNEAKELMHPSEKYHAFLDAEFNERDISSVGIIIVNNHNEIKDKYYSIVKPVQETEMTKYITDLTGFTYAQLVNAGADFYDVCCDINNIIRKYNVKKIYVWGDKDKKEFFLTRKAYVKTTKITKSVFKKCSSFVNLITDISEIVSIEIVGSAKKMSLQSLARVCHVYNKYEHNSLYDAECLYNCVKAFRLETYDAKLINEYKIYENAREEYIKCKRAKSTLVPLTKKYKFSKIKLSEDIMVLYEENPSVKAFVDDGISLGLIAEDSEKMHAGILSFCEYLDNGCVL